MDAEKIGKVIKDCRKEKGMTQKELAEKLMISDKTISKWERGLGCPDISFLTELSKILGLISLALLSSRMSASTTWASITLVGTLL